MTDPESQLMEDVSYVASSRERRLVLRELVNCGKATPSGINSELEGQPFANVSRALCKMERKGIVELLVPQDRHKGRIYAPTDHGKAVWDEVEGVTTRE